MLNLPFSLVVYLFIYYYYLLFNVGLDTVFTALCFQCCVFLFFFFFWHAIKKIVRLLFMHCS